MATLLYEFHLWRHKEYEIHLISATNGLVMASIRTCLKLHVSLHIDTIQSHTPDTSTVNPSDAERPVFQESPFAKHAHHKS